MYTWWLVCCMLMTAVLAGAAMAAPYRLADVNIVVADDAPPRAKLAADEIRSYVYQLTGACPAIGAAAKDKAPAIVIRVGASDRLPTGGADETQNFALYVEDDRQIAHGASDRAALWAAYELIEHWGVGFYLGGDALPPTDADRTVEPVDVRRRPVLAIRGNLPWFNFLNSPTTWNPQDYRTFFAQMAKQKASFIGFHAYDHEPFGAYDITLGGAKMGGPLMTTISPHRWWSPHAMTTKDHVFGTDLFFDRGEWGCEVGIDDAWTFAPGRATRWQQQMMASALAYAQRLGLATCIGWEVSGNPNDPAVREAFRRRLAHTLATYPLDYFWIWQSEGRGVGGGEEGVQVREDVASAFAYLGGGHNLSEAARITEFVRLAHATLKEMAPNVDLIVSGWGGDAWMRFSSLYEGLDKIVPPDVIFAALDNIDPRLQNHVSEAYGKLAPTRRRWPIPWFESDGGHTRIDQTGPQTNVTAFEPLLKDIVAKGCQGALGIHWRTRNVEDVAGYLYRFGWEPDLTAAEFFRRYASDHYGPDDAERMAKVHLRLEAFGPQYVGAAGCVECSTGFSWFVRSGSAEHGGEPNRAGYLPDASRFAELEAMAKDLHARSNDAAMNGRRPHAAMQYYDLACTIEWLVTRAKVGLAIWNSTAPLERRLRTAEALYDDGKSAEARDAAEAVLQDLEALNFRRAFRGLATTCRTRGELGMLATANARYGRFYATFVQRIARVLERPLPEVRGPEPWWGVAERSGPDVWTTYPVPNLVPADETVSFDAVLMPQRREGFGIELRRIDRGPADSEWLRFAHLGGAYHRAVFDPPGEGVWAWRLVQEGDARHPPDLFPPLARGVITVVAPAGPVKVSYRPPQVEQPKEAVLRLDFARPVDGIAERVGNVRTTKGVKGVALDLRRGGFVRVGDASGPAAFDGPFSIAMFVRAEPWDHDREMPVILCKGRYADDGYLIQLFHGAIRVCVGQARCLDAATLEPGRWTHLAVTYDGQELRLYLDGDVVGEMVVDTPLAPSTLPLRIGVYDEPGGNEVFPFRGCVEDVVFYRRALGADEIGRMAEPVRRTGRK